MSIKFWNLILVMALLATLAGGGYILHQNHEQKQAEIQKAELEASKVAEEKAQKEQQLKAEFESFLNDFLESLQEEVTSYKKNKIVLTSLVDPKNLRAPEYINENARLADSTVMALQLQMDTILGLFGQADEMAAELIVKFEEEKQVDLQGQWEKLKTTQSEKFMEFFAADQEIVLAYRDLAEFYGENSDALETDLTNNRIVFDLPELQEEEALLRGRIMELESRGETPESSSQ